MKSLGLIPSFEKQLSRGALGIAGVILAIAAFIGVFAMTSPLRAAQPAGAEKSKPAAAKELNQGKDSSAKPAEKPAAPPAAPSAELAAVMSQPPKSGYPRPAIVSRGEWGSKPAKTERLTTHTLKCITIHHGGEIYKGTPPPREAIRRLQSWGMAEKKWGDVPYHFQIDLDGVIYECRDLRYAGDTNTSYKPAGHALPCLMGNYEEQYPTEKQLDTLAELNAWLCSAYGLAPASIKGHKDYAETACPGKNFYPYVHSGDLARRTAEKLVAAGLYADAKSADNPSQSKADQIQRHQAQIKEIIESRRTPRP